MLPPCSMGPARNNVPAFRPGSPVPQAVTHQARRAFSPADTRAGGAPPREEEERGERGGHASVSLRGASSWWRRGRCPRCCPVAALLLACAAVRCAHNERANAGAVGCGPRLLSLSAASRARWDLQLFQVRMAKKRHRLSPSVGSTAASSCAMKGCCL